MGVVTFNCGAGGLTIGNNRTVQVPFATSVKFIGKEFSPPQDQSVFLIRVKARVDASIPYTNELMKRAEAYLRTVPEIKQTYVAVGGFGGTSYNTAMKVSRARVIVPTSPML